jgi:hypothetical protein
LDRIATETRSTGCIRHDGSVTVWEYRVVSLPRFESPTNSTAPSAAVEVLNEQGARGWEAVGMTVLPNGSVAVLLKKPKNDS